MNEKELNKATEEMKKDLTPTEYFEMVKDKKQKVTDEMLDEVYNSCLKLLSKYKITRQIKAMKKLMFHIGTIEKERELIKKGINTFVYYDDIETYIRDIAPKNKRVVKIIELENYERDIPDEIVAKVATVKELFTRMYVIFTDYTGMTERQIKREAREKDPILFGTFQDLNTGSIVERFYFIGDWVDEYCDLTLDKLVTEYKVEKGNNIMNTLITPHSLKELQKQLDELEEDGNGGYRKIKKRRRLRVFLQNDR